MKILEVKELVKHYGQDESLIRAVDYSSLSVEKGEFVAIVGTSGSGKTTLLNLIGGLDTPDNGEIIISSKSKKYTTCVPLTALRQGAGDSYYVLVVTEKETVLGEELIAKKIDLNIEKRDGEYAAVTEGALGKNDKIIVDSNKIINDGDRVRLETE